MKSDFSSRVVLLLSQINPVPTPLNCYFKIHLNIFLALKPRSCQCSLSSVSPPKCCMSHSSHPLRTTFHAQLVLIHFTSRITSGEDYSTCSSSWMFPLTSSPLNPTVFLNTKTAALWSSLNVTDQVFYLYKTTNFTSCFDVFLTVHHSTDFSKIPT